MSSRDKLSTDSLSEATRSRAKFSGHGSAKGAAGYLSDTDDDSGCKFLGETGMAHIIDTAAAGFEKMRIGAAWQNIQVQEAGFFNKILKKVTKQGVDLDLGCLYELQDGTRGAVQAFGELFGDFENAPYMQLSGDDRTGDDDDDDDGEDEILFVNGRHWGEIRRMLIYLYIYDGAINWAQVKPQVQIRVPGFEPMIVNLHTYKSELAVCAVAGIENQRGGIKVTNFTEYYPGHAEMDRAHGFGLEWDDGRKS
jgi:tellurite resistance protein TerA